MSKERRTFGPPGTGKTTWLSTHLIPEAAAKYGPENVLVCSYTRTAAKEIATKPANITTAFTVAGETVPIPEENIGTLHSICFRALGSPKIIETEKKLLQQWSELHPEMAISGTGARAIEGAYDEDKNDKGNGLGDLLLAAYNIKRNRLLTDQKMWQLDLRRFAKAWEEFKEEVGACDFTDLISICLKDKPYAPGRPKVIVVDEAQDLTKLQLQLIRRWAADVEELHLVGDDDQCIFSFSGATHDAFLTPPIPDEDKTILGQSYRVPRLVLERANAVIEQVSERQPKNYLPRTDADGNVVDGDVTENPATYSKPQAAIDIAYERTQSGKSVMILATCSYMLEAVKRELRARGLPFENRYRRSRADWNPLYTPPTKNGTISAPEILKDFMAMGKDAPYWTGQQLITWAQYIKVGEDGLRKKVGKKIIEQLKILAEDEDPRLFTTREVLPQIMTEAAAERALARDHQWLLDNLRADRANERMEYAFQVGRTFGFEALFERPKITIGTIHSVKGAEAASVILFPDLSWQADNEMQQSQDGIDRACRVMYVGMTRAREELIICNPNVTKSRIPRMYVRL